MRSIIAINESTKAAYTKSNRILAKYLNQIGSRTYTGSLSEEGIEDLRLELVSARSRYMSVVVRLVGKNHQDDILFTVGSTKQFDEDTGLYAFRQQGAPLRLQFANLSPVHQYLQSLVKIASLLHDLGKANDAFQAKLHNKIRGAAGLSYEYVRHDAMGYLMLHLMMQHCPGVPLLSVITDQSAYESACDTLAQIKTKALNVGDSALRAYFEDAKQTASTPCGLPLASFAQLLKAEITRVLEGKITSAALFTESAILWLVLSHHRLPLTKQDTSDPSNSLDVAHLTYINKNATIGNKVDLRFLDVPKSTLPICDQNYAKALEQAVIECKDREDALQSMNWQDPDMVHSLYSILFHFARPMLVFADHLGSVQRKDKFDFNEKDKTVPIANLQTTDKQTYKGDSLKTHLMTVSKKSRQLTNLAYFAMKHRENTDFFPRLPVAKATELNRMLNTVSPASPFYWQDQAHAAIKAHRGQSFLVNIIAETGSGKTIASGKIAAALSPTLRYVYCLGLRSLTLQTSKSYANDLGIESVATIIGDQLVKEMFNRQNQQNGSEPAPGDDLGLEAATSSEDNPDTFVDSSSNHVGNWLEYLDDKKSPYRLDTIISDNVTKLLDTPVVIATIDQLISLVKLDTIQSAKLYPRLFCSDLILDEVDNYDLDQINMLSKLIYLTAMYGNSVICMSATLNVSIAAAFAEAFAAGVREHNMLMNGNRKALLANVSNRTAPEIIELSPLSFNEKAIKGTDLSSFKAISSYNQHFVDTVKSAPIKHHVEQLDIGLAVNEETFDIIQTRCDRYHDEVCQSVERNVTIPEYPQIKHVSVGFVKFNSVRQARNFARYAMETVPEVDSKLYSVLCYHAKYTLAELNKIDKILNTLVNRKNLQPNAALSDDAIKQILTPLLDCVGLDQVDDMTSIQILVVTTSILETGRDHDYDYCVLEPNSTRSLIQAAGRVYRHRKAEGLRRVSVLSSTVKPQNSWQLRTNLFKDVPRSSSGRMAVTKSDTGRTPTAAEVFNIDNKGSVLTSASSLLHNGEGALMHKWEQFQYDTTVLSPSKALLDFYNKPKLFVQHAIAYLVSYRFLAGVQYKIPFRQSVKTLRYSLVSELKIGSKLRYSPYVVQINHEATPHVYRDETDSYCSIVSISVVARHRALTLCVYVNHQSEHYDQSAEFVVGHLVATDFKEFDDSKKAKMLEYNLACYANSDASATYNALIGFDTE